MAPPPPSTTSRTAALILRVLTFLFLIVSLIVLTTNTATLLIELVELKFHFKDINAYRYMLAAIVIGFAYTILQIAFTLYNITTGNRMIRGDGNLLFDFYGDKAISYLLATGAAAGFAATKDMKPIFEGAGLGTRSVDNFFTKGYVSASLLLGGFICTAALSVLSSFALPKQAN